MGLHPCLLTLPPLGPAVLKPNLKTEKPQCEIITGISNLALLSSAQRVSVALSVLSSSGAWPTGGKSAIITCTVNPAAHGSLNLLSV